MDQTLLHQQEGEVSHDAAQTQTPHVESGYVGAGERGLMWRK